MSEAAARAPYRTIPVRPETWERLQALRMGGATYDRVINDLMDMAPIEKVSDAFLREHFRRLQNFQGVDWADLREKYVRKRGSRRA